MSFYANFLFVLCTCDICSFNAVLFQNGLVTLFHLCRRWQNVKKMLRGKNQPQLRSLVINWEGIYHLTPSLWNRIVLWWSPKIEKRKKNCKFLININSSCQLVNLKGNKNHYSLKVISQYDLSQVSDNYSWNDGGGKNVCDKLATAVKLQ